MNAARRKEIARALEKLDDVKTILEMVKEEEENAYENLPEGIQDSERGERMQEVISRPTISRTDNEMQIR